MNDCPLCNGDGGIAVYRDDVLRVIRVEDADFPAYYRVVWNRHVAELTDLAPDQRVKLIDTVATVETTLRTHLVPDKINLASLGNMVPHLHWHVIARFAWDSHFPNAIWGQRERDPVPAAASRLPLELTALDARLRGALVSGA